MEDTMYHHHHGKSIKCGPDETSLYSRAGTGEILIQDLTPYVPLQNGSWTLTEPLSSSDRKNCIRQIIV
jgi:hypothetical protein